MDSEPLRSTKGTFSSLYVSDSATIKQNIYYSGSINIEPGTGIIFDGKKISATGGTASIAGVTSINNETGTIQMVGGNGLSIASASGTIQYSYDGAVIYGAGDGLLLNNGTISSTISPGISSIVAGAGISIEGGSTITNTGTYAIGSGLDVNSGTLYSTISPGISSIVAGAGISIEGGSTITNTGTYAIGSGLAVDLGTLYSTSSGAVSVGNGLEQANSTIYMSGTLSGPFDVTGQIYGQGGLKVSSIIYLPSSPGIGGESSYIQLGDFQPSPIVFGIDQGLALGATISVATDYSSNQSSTAVNSVTVQDVYIDSSGQQTIREYGKNTYHIYEPLTVDKFATLPIGSGLEIASNTLYATGGGTSSSITPDYVVAESGTLYLGAKIPTSGSVVSATISLINGSSTQSTSPFQQRISVDYASANLGSYINSTLTNIQFTDLSGSTIIPSWRESGTATSDTASYWLKLAQGIPASSTLYVLMNVFTDKHSVLNASDTGVAPTLPQYYGDAYGTDDTGTIIFDTADGLLYDNFAGTVLSGLWSSTIATGATLAVNNGLELTSAGASWSYLSSTLQYNLAAYALHTRSYFSLLTGHGWHGIGFQNGIVAPQNAITDNSTSDYTLFNYNGTPPSEVSISGGSTSVYNIWDMYGSSSESFLYLNNSSSVVNDTDYTSTVQRSISILAYSGTATDHVQWLFVRNQAPDYLMPTANVAPVQSVVPTIEFAQDSKFLNPPSSTVAQWSELYGKPAVTLSAVGTTTSSTILYKNDGADFGPDSTSGGTITNTSGILEAIQYFGTRGGRMVFRDGTYAVSSTVFSSNGNALITFPEITQADGYARFELIGESFTQRQQEASGFTNPPITQGVIIKPTHSAPTASSTSETPYAIFGVPPVSAGIDSYQNSIQLYFDGISFLQPNPSTYTDISAAAALNMVVKNSGLDTDADWTSLSQPTSVQSVGVICTQTASTYTELDNIQANGRYLGILVGPHTQMSGMDLIGCHVALSGNMSGKLANHGVKGDYLALEWCAYYFGNSVYPLQVAGTNALWQFDYVEVSDAPTGGTSQSWMRTVSYFYGTGSDVPKISIQAWRRLNQGSGLTYVSDGITDAIVLIHDAEGETPSTPTNPPVSGSIYQNVNPFDVTLMIPAEFYTASATGSITPYIGDTNAVSEELPTIAVPNGAVTGQVLVYNVPVHAQWYYKIEAVSATLHSFTQIVDATS